jgi:hypothetical protein
VAIVEKWNPHSKIRQDLFGFADLLGCHPVHGIACFQVTSTKVKERIDKILAETRAENWLRCGGLIYVHGWRKLKKKKKDGTYSKVSHYVIREEHVTLLDFLRATPGGKQSPAPAVPKGV